MEENIEQPKRVKIITWALLLLSILAIAVFSLTLDKYHIQKTMAKSPLPWQAAIVMVYLDQIVTIICAVAMMGRVNWARYLYLGYSLFNWIMSFLFFPIGARMIPGIIFFIVVLFVIFAPKSTAWFTWKPDDPINLAEES